MIQTNRVVVGIDIGVGIIIVIVSSLNHRAAQNPQQRRERVALGLKCLGFT